MPSAQMSGCPSKSWSMRSIGCASQSGTGISFASAAASRWTFGRASPPPHTDTQFMDEVFAARQSACNLAVQEALRVSDDEADNGPRRKVARKGFKATAKHATVAPHAIEVTLPQVGSLPPRKAWALFEGIGTGTFWLELTSPNLEHLREGAQTSPAIVKSRGSASKGRAGKPKPEAGPPEAAEGEDSVQSESD